MTAPPFRLYFTPEFQEILGDLEGDVSFAVKLKKVRKTLAQLEAIGPAYPGLNSHRYQSVTGPGGQQLWESYVENQTPSAWRMFWVYGPGEDELTIVTVGPHP